MGIRYDLVVGVSVICGSRKYRSGVVSTKKSKSSHYTVNCDLTHFIFETTAVVLALNFIT